MGFCFDFQGRVFGPVDNGAPLFCIAGPCALESRAHALEVSAALREIFAAAGVPFIYKSSFDKANRSSGASFRGVGMTEGLAILAEVRERVGVPVLARAAVAVGVAGLFLEVHPDPDKAPCDGPNMLALRDLPSLLNQLGEFDRLAKQTAGVGA